jgi:hypothetical protein
VGYARYARGCVPCLGPFTFSTTVVAAAVPSAAAAESLGPFALATKRSLALELHLVAAEDHSGRVAYSSIQLYGKPSLGT